MIINKSDLKLTSNRALRSLSWYRNDQLHCEHGPAWTIKFMGLGYTTNKYYINGYQTAKEYVMTKEKETEEEIVSIISTNDKEVEDGSEEAYLKYEHGIPLNHNQFTSLAKKITVEDDEYVNFTKGVESDFVLCFHDEYTIKFKNPEDLCVFKLENAECLHASE